MIDELGNKARQIPPAGWVALTALAGVVFLCWHSFARDEDDHSWTDPPADQFAPISAGVPGVSDGVLPGACGGAFRSRRYPGSLASSRTSHIGGWIG